MWKNINAVKIGNTVKISIAGKLHSKNCGSAKEANELFKLGLAAKEDPSDANIKAIRLFLNEKTRIAMLAGLEADTETGEVYLAGFNTPIPMALVEVIKDYHENGYPLDAIINFWKLLMINPDKRVRTSLFDFITTHDFALTDKGYMIVYKAVYRKNLENPTDSTFEEFVTNQTLMVKNKWKCSPNKYVVYKEFGTTTYTDDDDEDHEVFDYNDFTYNITKVETADGWNEKERGIEVLGKLGDLFKAIVNNDNDDKDEPKVQYTDMYTRTMTIELGVPVHMERKNTDSDPKNECSYGLHVGSTKYVENYGSSSNCVILVCLVNPANVVAVPDYDKSKLRTTEYFPYARATYIDGKIEIVESAYFEEEYTNFVIEDLEMQIELIKAEELPIETAMKAEAETRPMQELLKMVEGRLVELEAEID